MAILDSLKGNIGASLGAGLNQGYSQSANSGGSVNSAESYNNSYNMSNNEAWSRSESGTDATTARMWSALMAEDAWQKNLYAMDKQMNFNREEAEKQRAWQAEMANTLYTRSVKNMKEAGINPILAANMGLSGANVGSGATASLAGAASAPLAQNFMDSWSGSESYSHGSSYGEGEGSSWGTGSSWNSGWSNSEEGLITALNGLGDMAMSALNAVNAGTTLDRLNQKYGQMTDNAYKAGEKIRNGVQNVVQGIGNTIKSNLDTIAGNKGGGHGFGKKMKN